MSWAKRFTSGFVVCPSASCPKRTSPSFRDWITAANCASSSFAISDSLGRAADPAEPELLVSFSAPDEPGDPYLGLRDDDMSWLEAGFDEGCTVD
jgi:hypothetical protein